LQLGKWMVPMTAGLLAIQYLVPDKSPSQLAAEKQQQQHPRQ
jgi:hypothetical protein